MAIIWASASGITKKASGWIVKSVSRQSTQAGDLTIAVDTTKVTDKGAALEACRAVLDHLLSDTLK